VNAPVVEFVSPEALKQLVGPWRDLCARAAESNPFVDPDFLLPLIAYENPSRLTTALVWATGGRLIGFVALQLPPLGLGLAHVWQSAYSPLPASAFDREAIPDALAALVAGVRDQTRLAGIIWTMTESVGALAETLGQIAKTHTLSIGMLANTRRAALRLAGLAAFEAGLDPERRRRWRRQARRLAERGRVETMTGAEAVEAFLSLESKGWKGRRGTALADDPARLAFARSALEAFARAGRLDALTLVLDGAPIAAGLMLMSGARGYYWKSAYDEAFAGFSPGLQLALAHSRRLSERPGLALLDSCALENHPMIGRVWSDQLAFEDIALGLRPGASLELRAWIALARVRATAREALKRLVFRALGRKR
jgi:CelD/BcsL family acetyltransferase involved in cellulose biosynthesis